MEYDIFYPIKMFSSLLLSIVTLACPEKPLVLLSQDGDLVLYPDQNSKCVISSALLVSFQTPIISCCCKVSFDYESMIFFPLLFEYVQSFVDSIDDFHWQFPQKYKQLLYVCTYIWFNKVWLTDSMRLIVSCALYMKKVWK